VKTKLSCTKAFDAGNQLGMEALLEPEMEGAKDGDCRQPGATASRVASCNKKMYYLKLINFEMVKDVKLFSGSEDVSPGKATGQL
jgi:hypothetical protein